jgi:hypothetical protein
VKLQSKVFQSSGSWESLSEDVIEWVNANLTPETLVSISMSESGRVLLDTSGTIIVWYWE